MKELQVGYSVCPMCRYDKVSVTAKEAISKGWWRQEEPEYLEVTCLGCDYITPVRPGTATLINQVTVETTSCTSSRKIS